VTDPQRCILVVDDSEMNVDMLARRLQRSGYDVLTASSGPAALEIIERERLDLVLLDVMMPGMSGIEVLETIRRTHSSSALPVVMATAKSDARDTVEALDKGANDYVTKPIPNASVCSSVRTGEHRPGSAGLPARPALH
jgi:DNA-binding response OmpR family regulator